MTNDVLERARAGDQAGFRELTDPYRRELQIPDHAPGAYFRAPRTEIARLYGNVVLTLEGRQISAITWFGGNSAFAHFGLPRILR